MSSRGTSSAEGREESSPALSLDQAPTQTGRRKLVRVIIFHMPSPPFPEGRFRHTSNPIAWFPLAPILCTTATGPKSSFHEFSSSVTSTPFSRLLSSPCHNLRRSDRLEALSKTTLNRIRSEKRTSFAGFCSPGVKRNHHPITAQANTTSSVNWPKPNASHASLLIADYALIESRTE